MDGKRITEEINADPPRTVRRFGRVPSEGNGGWYFSLSARHLSLYTRRWYYWWRRRRR